MGFTQPTIASGTTNVLIFGPSGHGKTTGAGTACNDVKNPDVAILNTEGGGWQSIAHQLGYVPYVWDIASKADLTNAWKELKDGKHKHIKTVIIDSATDLAKLMLDNIVESTSRRRPAQGVPCMEDFNELSVTFDRMLRRFRDLDLNVILIALEKDEVEEYEENGKQKRRVIGTLPEVPGKLARRLPALVDACFYAQAMEVTKTEQYPDGMRYVWQTRPARGRLCKLRGAALPMIIDQNWRTLAAAFGRDEGLPVPAVVEQKAKPTEQPKAAAKKAAPKAKAKKDDADDSKGLAFKEPADNADASQAPEPTDEHTLAGAPS